MKFDLLAYSITFRVIQDHVHHAHQYLQDMPSVSIPIKITSCVPDNLLETPQKTLNKKGPRCGVLLAYLHNGKFYIPTGVQSSGNSKHSGKESVFKGAREEYDVTLANILRNNPNIIKEDPQILIQKGLRVPIELLCPGNKCNPNALAKQRELYEESGIRIPIEYFDRFREQLLIVETLKDPMQMEFQQNAEIMQFNLYTLQALKNAITTDPNRFNAFSLGLFRKYLPELLEKEF